MGSPASESSIETIMRSPPTSRARFTESPISNMGPAPVSQAVPNSAQIMHLKDLRGANASLALGGQAATQVRPHEQQPAAAGDDASMRSGRSVQTVSLAKEFPHASKQERPILKYPWQKYLDGATAKEATKQLKKAHTESEGCPVWGPKLQDHRLYVQCAAEMNLFRMVELETAEIYAIQKKLKPVMGDHLPKRNFMHLIGRYSLDECMPKSKKVDANFWERLFPKPGSESGATECDSQDPRVSANCFSEDDLVSGVVPETVRTVLSEYIFKPMVIEGSKHKSNIIVIAAGVVEIVSAYP